MCTSLPVRSFYYSVNCIACAPWQCGLVFVAGSSDGQVTVLSHAQDNWNVLQFVAHKSGVTAVSCGLGPDEAPKQVRGLVARQDQPEEEQKGGEDAPGLRFVTGGTDGLVKLWNYSREGKVFESETIAARSAWIKDAIYVQNNAAALALPAEYLGGHRGEVVAFCAEDRTVWVLRRAEGKWHEFELPAQKLPVVRLSWNVDGHVLAAAAADGTVLLFEEASPGRWECFSTIKSAQPPVEDSQQPSN